MSITSRLRVVFTCLFIGLVISATVGWFLDKDPAKLAPVIAWVTGAIVAGEASNVGKRATFKKEAIDVPPETMG